VQLDSIPVIDIANGTHKYVQIELRLTCGQGGASGASSSSGTSAVTRRIIRSYAGLKSHAENYRVAMQRTLATLHRTLTATTANTTSRNSTDAPATADGSSCSSSSSSSSGGMRSSGDRSGGDRSGGDSNGGGSSSVLRGLSGTVVGGGRITCDHERRVATVFGYSRTFGRSIGCNKRTAGLVSAHWKYEVSWRDDGY
jgi:hypothetical protein